MIDKERGYEYNYPLASDPSTITLRQTLVYSDGSPTEIIDSNIYTSNSHVANVLESHTFEGLYQDRRSTSIVVLDPVKGTYKVKLRFNYLHHVKKVYTPSFERNKVFTYTTVDEYPTFVSTNVYTINLGTGPKSILNWPANELISFNNGTLIHPDKVFYSQLMTQSNMISYIRRMLSEDRLLALPNFSLGNFIAEFHEIKNLATLHRERVSGMFLGINFGVLPLIGDLSAMFEIFKNFESKIAVWNSYVTNLTTLNYHTTILNETVTDSGYTDADVGHGYVRYSWQLDVVVVIRSSVYLCPQLIPESSYRSILMALTGLDDPFSIIWEAVPYSFIVDWFTNIGDMIEQAEFDPSVIQFRIDSGGFSRSVKGKIKCQAVYYDPDGNPTPLGSNDEDVDWYTRIPINLDDYTSGNFTTNIDSLEFSNSINGYKGLLLSALVDQRIRR